ncbi:uncharacterized protein LOC136035681 isoform X2 [Artemia franciscana]|uniref:phosphoethanolamine N-methyltransferase n=1 Tax=Artemia franciscana TaxID=6661 RepID=A0AA88HZK0_ARTSF|nr:hypothetical protein QYM36_010062 [Artemia franciscana]
MHVEKTEEVRNAMRKYWQQYEPTIESMMLSDEAKNLDQMEKWEILSYVPDIREKSVLELGAGIGRFTEQLAAVAAQVTAVDFMESYTQQNRERNSKFDNIDFLRADVTELELPSFKYDVIFSNWLLMYLDDNEVRLLVRKMLTWLKDDGYLFIRESCFHPSGNIKIGENPTFYRTPTEYFRILQSETSPSGISNLRSVFVLKRATSVKAYIKAKANPNQLCFLLKKMTHSEEQYESFQAFLDENQYSRSGILRYERIFGPTFVSTGGLETTMEFCKLLNLKPGMKVLDVGCGIGGSAFHMAGTYGVEVHGVDLSTNMITLALENQAKQPLEVKTKVSFEICDITKHSFPEGSFDVVYSRDTILHIGDKETLFSHFYKWLKPGGRVLISDYCRGEQEHSEDFTRYVSQRGYHLLTVQQYGEVLSTVGFKEVEAIDKTSFFIDILKKEVKNFHAKKDEFVKEFSERDYDYILEGWEAKVKRCSAGDQAWGLFIANKPQ